MKRIIVFALLAAGCMQTHLWQCQQIITGEVQYDSLRIVCPARDKVNDIEIEVLKTDAACTLTLCVHGQPIFPCENNAGHTLVNVKIASKVFREFASLHAGGQRVKLSPSLQEAILAQLRSGGFVEIELPGYKMRVDSDNFPDFVSKLDAPPHFRIPIDLSF